MNIWIEKSLQLAIEKDYVDRLFEIYPIESNELREISPEFIERIKKIYEERDIIGLFEILLTLEKFPINHSFMGMLGINKDVRSRNPKTVKKIADMLLGKSFENIINLCESPKSSSKQIGPMFKNWLKSKYQFLPKEKFETTVDKVVFLEGDDTKLKNYVNDKFDAGLGPPHFKGLDFFFRKNDKFFMGEAKLITRSGGTQSNQFNLAIKVADLEIRGLTSLGIIDGVPWFVNSFKNQIRQHPDKNILSGLLLDEFINQI